MTVISEMFQVDRLPATAQECVKANHADWLARGYKVENGWDAKGPQPYVHLLTDDPDMLDKYPEDEIKDEFWIASGRGIDHIYRLQGNLTTLYVSEPYWTALDWTGLNWSHLPTMQRKVGRNWRIEIGSLPLWYPGRTIQLIFRRNIS